MAHNSKLIFERKHDEDDDHYENYYYMKSYELQDEIIAAQEKLKKAKSKLILLEEYKRNADLEEPLLEVGDSVHPELVARVYAADDDLDKANYKLALAKKNTASALRKLNKAQQRSEEAAEKAREAWAAKKQATRKLRKGIKKLKADLELNPTALSLASRELLNAKQQLAALLFELATLEEEDVTCKHSGYLRDAEFNVAKFRERVESLELSRQGLDLDLKELEDGLVPWDNVETLYIMEEEKSKLKASVQAEGECLEMQREMLRRERSDVLTKSVEQWMVDNDLIAQAVVKTKTTIVGRQRRN